MKLLAIMLLFWIMEIAGGRNNGKRVSEVRRNNKKS